MPIRDEAPHLAEVVGAVLAQDYPGELDVTLAVGPSGDGTEGVADGLAASDPPVRVVANPAGTIPAGLNAAIRASAGEVVLRVDGHSQLPAGYVRRAVELLEETGADNVGGVQRAAGTGEVGAAVAAAMTSPFGVGDARFHYGGEPGPTDTVYLGVFRRAALERVGGYDEALLRNEDYELNLRIRETGGTVWFSPDLEVRYAPRSNLRALARQYHDYGRWKREVLARHPGSLRWRQAVPPLAVVANAAALLAAAAGRRQALIVPGAYVAASLGASALAARGLPRRSARWLPAVFAVMHHAWGLGFLRGAPGDAEGGRHGPAGQASQGDGIGK
jgi:succinoglycan biosynthesis protein ExoA